MEDSLIILPPKSVANVRLWVSPDGLTITVVSDVKEKPLHLCTKDCEKGFNLFSAVSRLKRGLSKDKSVIISADMVDLDTFNVVKSTTRVIDTKL